MGTGPFVVRVREQGRGCRGAGTGADARSQIPPPVGALPFVLRAGPARGRALRGLGETATSHHACGPGAGTAGSGSVSTWTQVGRSEARAAASASRSWSQVAARCTTMPSEAALAARSTGSGAPV